MYGEKDITTVNKPQLYSAIKNSLITTKIAMIWQKKHIKKTCSLVHFIFSRIENRIIKPENKNIMENAWFEASEASIFNEIRMKITPVVIADKIFPEKNIFKYDRI